MAVLGRVDPSIFRDSNPGFFDNDAEAGDVRFFVASFTSIVEAARRSGQESIERVKNVANNILWGRVRSSIANLSGDARESARASFEAAVRILYPPIEIEESVVLVR